MKRSSSPEISAEKRAQLQETEAETTAGEKESLPLAGDEAEVLNKLEEAMGKGDLEEAGKIINQNENTLAGLYYGTAEGKPVRYKDGVLTSALEGSGMVLKGSGTCFYGTFSAAGPEGFCRAVKGTVLERPRCDFSEGEWQEGKMTGEGKTGYSYYEGAHGEEVRAVLRQGTFLGDVLDGPFTYHSINGSGETSVWTMEADQGHLVLNERWEYLEEKMEYRLPSDNDETHVYVVFESGVSEAVWGNLLRWE